MPVSAHAHASERRGAECVLFVYVFVCVILCMRVCEKMSLTCDGQVPWQDLPLQSLKQGVSTCVCVCLCAGQGWE